MVNDGCRAPPTMLALQAGRSVKEKGHASQLSQLTLISLLSGPSRPGFLHLIGQNWVLLPHLVSGNLRNVHFILGRDVTSWKLGFCYQERRESGYWKAALCGLCYRKWSELCPGFTYLAAVVEKLWTRWGEWEPETRVTLGRWVGEWGGAHAEEGQQDSPGLTGFHQLGVSTWKDAKNTPNFRSTWKGCWWCQ